MKVTITKNCYADNRDKTLGPVGRDRRKPGDIVDSERGALLVGSGKAVKFDEEVGLAALLGPSDAETDLDETEDDPEDESNDDDSDEEQEETAESAPASGPANAPQGPRAGKKVMDFAMKQDVDLSQVEGTGPNDTITMKDVEKVMKARKANKDGLTTR